MLCEDTHGNKFLVKAIKNCDIPWTSEEVICLFVFFSHESSYFHCVIPEKIPTPTMEGRLENLFGVGVNGSGNPDGRGGLSEPENTSSCVTFDFIDVSIASIDKFSKNCFAFSNFIILSNYRPLTTFILSFHP